MRIVILYNRDFDAPAEHDPGFAARAGVEGVARDIARALAAARGWTADVVACRGRTLDFARRFSADPPDLVFNLCESLAGDARGEVAIPAILDALGIPYTGSAAFGLAAAQNKPKTKHLLAGQGVSVPWGRAFADVAELAGVEVPLPAIVKPAREDASVGIEVDSVVRDRAALERQVARVIAVHRQPALVEQYVDGREIYVAMLGNEPRQVLPFTEIDFSALPPDRPRIVTYAAKWEPGSVDDLGTRSVVAQVDDEALRARIERTARAAFEAVELYDYARVDVRVDGAGQPFVIDVNPNCDLGRDAGFARAAAAAGLTYEAAVVRIAEVALQRHHADSTRRAARSPEAGGAARHDR